VANEHFSGPEKPKGISGSIFLWLMNRTHAKMANWGLQYLPIKDSNHILDIGCGGGANIHRMLKMADDLKVFGLDYSKLSVEKSREYNRDAKDKGKCEILEGSVSNIPYKEGAFDIVTAFQTIFFWPDMVNDIKEVLRILKSGGIFFICNAGFISNDGNMAIGKFTRMRGMRLYSTKEYDSILTECGFINIKINISNGKKLICVIGEKP
jgi:SAM-dependent methyltransferase